jgi:hypothetical protein
MSRVRNGSICGVGVSGFVATAAPSSVYPSLSKIMHQMDMSRPASRN